MNNLLDPAILFFMFGALAGLARSNLEIPPAISRFLSLYLLMALGLKGGFALAQSGITAEVGASLGAALALAVAVPLMGYAVLRRLVGGFDAAALAATYGSVSAVTFVTAVQYLDNQSVAYGGHMAAAMALMESPAIIIAVLLANMLRQQQTAGAPASVAYSASGTFGTFDTFGSLGTGGAAAALAPMGGGTSGAGGARSSVPLGRVLHESFTDGAQLLLLGAMLIGLLSGAQGQAAMQPFTGDLFKGMLAFFLLDMGLTVARNLPKLRGCSPWLLAYAAGGPVVHATLALALAAALGLDAGNGALLMVLAASASYIAVPAVLRHAMPEANPSLYFGMSLGVTFPLNIIVGIPVYTAVALNVLG